MKTNLENLIEQTASEAATLDGSHLMIGVNTLAICSTGWSDDEANARQRCEAFLRTISKWKDNE